MDFEVVIGLEVHTQLKTNTKLFCGCSTAFGAEANSQTCPVCLGLPGVLPVMNKTAFECAVKTALAFNCSVAKVTKFDRKNYFYPDLPKNYQISQYDIPIGYDGYLEIDSRKIGIKRVHLEEDAGKLIHSESAGNCNAPAQVGQTAGDQYSLVDLNRTGVPLVEIVSKPEIKSAEEAYQYLTALKSLLIYLGVSDCDMEKGSLRCDANLSIRPKGSDELNTKTEVKNLNSFKFVVKALEYEANRQMALLREGKKVAGETRLWDDVAQETRPMRSKEDIQDYRYFPEPDLKSYVISEDWLSEVGASLPELPAQRKKRYMNQYQLSAYNAGVLLQSKDMADYFEECLKYFNNPKSVSNWLMSEVMRYLNESKKEIRDIGIAPQRIAELLKLFDEKKITSTATKEVWNMMIANPDQSPIEIVQQKGLAQINDESVIEGFVKEVIEKNARIAGDYKSGKKSAIEALVGQVMKLSKGKASPDKVRALLQNRLNS